MGNIKLKADYYTPGINVYDISLSCIQNAFYCKQIVFLIFVFYKWQNKSLGDLVT